jgi:hypothetical protein
LRKGCVAIGHVVLQVDDALGPAGRARRIHPERHLVAIGVGLSEIGVKIRQPAFGDDRLRHGVTAGLAVDHDQRMQRGIPAGLGVEARAKFGIGDGNSGTRIRQIELQQVRRRQRIDQQGDETGAHRAEKRRRIGRRVVEEHQDAVAALQSERRKAVAPARGVGAKLGIAARPQWSRQRYPVAAAFGKIVEQDAAGVVVLRDRKSDLARAGAVWRDGVEDRLRGRRHR